MKEDELLFQLDETPVMNASVSSIDTEKVNSYLAKLGQSLLNDEDNDALVRELINLSILLNIDNKLYPSLGGILAFGKNPQKYFCFFRQDQQNLHDLFFSFQVKLRKTNPPLAEMIRWLCENVGTKPADSTGASYLT